MTYWLPSKYDGYEVSSCGRIKSVARIIPRRDTGTLVHYPGIELKQQIDNCGYYRVRLSVNNLKITVKVHRLVAETFVENKHNLNQVNHVDGNKTNNNFTNLEWVTNSENQKHAITTGLRVVEFATRATAFTGSVEVYDSFGNLVTTLSGSHEMLKFGVDPRLVSACILGKRKTHKGFKFIKLNKE